jgi:integrase
VKTLELYKTQKSKFYWYDFTVAGKRYRGSTKETNERRAQGIASMKFSQAAAGDDPLPRKAPTLRKFSTRFKGWVEDSSRAAKIKAYYRDGWKLIEKTDLAGLKLTAITPEQIDMTTFPCGPSNTNMARRTLRRMLRLAESWGMLRKAPKVTLVAEYPRRYRLSAELEQKLLVGASKCNWAARRRQRFRDVVQLMRDTGLRNERELYRLRIENIDLANREIFVPDSKTPEGRRVVPILDRAHDILIRFTAGCAEGWLFPAKRGKEKRLTTMAMSFREARRAAGLPEDLKLYCGRHDYGTEAYKQTGNLALVMKVMGHKDAKTTMRYQHPDVQDLRVAMDAREPSRHTLRHTGIAGVN